MLLFIFHTYIYLFFLIYFHKDEDAYDVDSLGCRMNVEDDLWSRRRPLEVTSDPNP